MKFTTAVFLFAAPATWAFAPQQPNMFRPHGALFAETEVVTEKVRLNYGKNFTGRMQFWLEGYNY